MSPTTHTCKNCDATVTNNYCNVCGQKITVSKITVKETVREIAQLFFSVDAPFIVTLKYIFINPGKLFREFIAGKRKTYYKPVAFFILMTVLYVLMSSITQYDPLKNAEMNTTVEDVEKLLFDAGRFMLRNITNFLFFFVFALGISLKLFFRKRYSFAEYLAVSFYLGGTYVLLVCCMMFFMKMIPLQLHSLPIFIMLIYFLYAMMSFFQTKSIGVFVKLIIAYFIAVFLYILCSFGLSLFIISFKS